MHSKHDGYYGNLNRPVLEAIPAEARVVLEIGCGSGALGRAYKGAHPDCRFYGVEIHPASAAQAATHLDLVLCGSVDSVDLDFLQGSVDCLVYADVLEHLTDPWGVLARHRALLSAGGKAVASIPNVQHWSVIEHLLRGGWTYTDHGILDDTHLRFFTYDSIIALFERAGFTVDSMVGLLVSPERASGLAERLAPALEALGADPERLALTASPVQFLVSASVR